MQFAGRILFDGGAVRVNELCIAPYRQRDAPVIQFNQGFVRELRERTFEPVLCNGQQRPMVGQQPTRHALTQAVAVAIQQIEYAIAVVICVERKIHGHACRVEA